MNAEALKIVFALVALALEKGIPFVQSAIDNWSTTDEDITLDKIEALKIIKEPEEY